MNTHTRYNAILQKHKNKAPAETEVVKRKRQKTGE